MIIESTILVHRDELTRKEWRKVFHALTFFDAEENTVTCYRWLKKQNMVELPRGAWSLLPDREYGEFIDNRTYPSAPRHAFMVKLGDLSKGKGFEGQEDAVNSMLMQEQGLVIRPPGTGKTQIALAFIAACETNTLVIVHTEDILQQWVQYAQRAIPTIDVGVIRAGEFEIKQLTIATVQTVKRRLREYRLDWAKEFGAIISDEAHHVPANTWETIMNASPARFRFGFSATEKRADGREPLMRSLVGPVIHKLEFKSQVPITCRPLKTQFYYGYRGAFDWHRLLARLTQDSERNKTIAHAAVEEIIAGNSVLVLSRRINHLQLIYDAMATRFPNASEQMRTTILTGRVSDKKRMQIVKDFRRGKIKCLLATQLADEALDVPRLNRVILTYPGKHAGRLIQQVGRAIREYPDKTEAIIYDVVDDRVSVLRRQWMERKQAYKSMKIDIERVKADDPTAPRRKLRDLLPARSKRSTGVD